MMIKLLLLNIGAAWCCSSIHVPSPPGTVIGRTMELGDAGGEVQQFGGLQILGTDPSDPSLPWTVSVHRRGEVVGKSLSPMCEACTPWTTKLGYVSVDVVGHPPGLPSVNLTEMATDGINEAGLTVSTHTLRQSVYMQPARDASATNVCFAAFTAWLLGTFASVQSLRDAIPNLNIVGPRMPVPEGNYIHWAIDDASEEHVVLEVLDARILLHNNTVGTFTNDPDFTWHLRNLNNFVNLRPDWPSNTGIQVQTEVGPIPTTIGHGFNLLGVPGDYSPPSRFVRLFYLRQYAVLRHPPKTLNESIALATGLLNNVFINKGTVASHTMAEALEFTQYTVLKIPRTRQFFFKDYANTHWRMVRLSALDLSPKPAAPIDVPLVDGTLGIEDVTARFT